MRATELLYKRHGDTVYRYAWHLLGRREDAEDATQATFLAVHGALSGGTAVLESGAWVMRIARNECMGRLRQTARRPAVRSLDDGFEAPAVGGVERTAELRDEMRTTRKTLAGLPVPEREAFVLREWLGFESSEAALALGMTAGEVDGLATRARRSLVIAVGGLEPAISCSGTRAALETGSLDRAAKVHLLRCPVCRGVRRALRPPEASARAAVAQRLSAVIPGFATGGGGIVAALTAKAATAPVLAKTAAIVAAAVATGGAVEQAIVREQPAHRARAHGGQAQAAPVRAVTHPLASRSASGARATPPRVTHSSAAAAFVTPATRGAAATPTNAHGARAGVDDRSGHSSVSDDTGGGNSDSGSTRQGSSDDTNSHSGRDDGGESASGKGASHHGSTSSGRDDGESSGTSGGKGEATGETSGSGKTASGHHSGSGDSGESHSGSVAATTAPVTAVPDEGDLSSSGKGSGDSGDSGDSSGEGSGGGDTHGGEAPSVPTTSD